MTDQGPGWGTPGPPGSAPLPPPAYQYPSGYGAPAIEGMAIAALILAICSFVVVWFIPFIPAIIALVLANASNKKIRESGGRLTGESLNKASIIIAWVNIGLWTAGTLLIILLVIIGAATTETMGMVA